VKKTQLRRGEQLPAATAVPLAPGSGMDADVEDILFSVADAAHADDAERAYDEKNAEN
jgi:hypothetical protein